jgi:hypothetical protein
MVVLDVAVTKAACHLAGSWASVLLECGTLSN